MTALSISDLLRINNFTQTKLARKIRVTRFMVCHYVAGRNNPSIEVAERIGHLTSSKPILQDGRVLFEPILKPKSKASKEGKTRGQR